MIHRCPKGLKVKVHKRTRVSNEEYLNPKSLPKITARFTVSLFSVDPLSAIGQIGFVDIVKTRYGFWETHSWLAPSYQNEGLGVMLYGKAIKFGIKQGYDIRSSLSPSSQARNVWESKTLRSKYKIIKKGKRYVAKKK